MPWVNRLIDRLWPPKWLYTTYERSVLGQLDKNALPHHVEPLILA